MQPLDTVYLQILKNLCTDSSDPVTLTGVDASALYRLAEKHCSLPFLLPYFENQPQFSALKQQTKQMLLSYYQLEHFTSLTFSLLLAEKIPCFLLKGIRFPNTGSWEIWISISMKKKLFPVPAGFSRRMAASRSRKTVTTTLPTAIRSRTRTVPSRWSCTTASSASISLPVRMSWWTRFSLRII